MMSNEGKASWQEKQRATDPSLLLVISIPLLVFLALALLFDDSSDATALTIGLVCFGFILIFLWILHLSVTINQAGIAYQYLPFHFSPRLIPWEDIQECKIVPVRAFSEYGGLGIRYSGRKKGYIINSKFGLEIYKKDKRIIVMSITHKEEAEKALQNFGPQPEVTNL